MIKPLENRIVVCPDKNPEKTESGIYLPDEAAKQQARDVGLRGTVLQVGMRRIEATGERCDSQVAPGHRVVYGRYAGTEVKADGEDLLILREDDILAIVGTDATP